MPDFSWKKIKDFGISETEKDRFCAIFLTNVDAFKPTAAQLASTAEEFGATPGGFKVMYGNIMKKYRDNNLYIDGEGGDSATTANGENGVDATASPAPVAKPKTPRKRKAATPAVDADGNPSPKKKGRPSKKEKEEAEAVVKAAVKAAEDAAAAAAAAGEPKQEAIEQDAGMGAVEEGETVEN
ncbi:hypothetical protein BLS_004195 [Venturia inaequalis]|uniref:Uncharacterized protein n=1 Tax=Venturia inaequalis TaxID=5025 RepID=A0A8H3YSK2_VENIN|nr:hypothetical protein BLS_004195 [Venturia inaequalis]